MQVLGLARAVRRQGHDVRVLAPCDGPPPEVGVIPLGQSVPAAANGSVAPAGPGPVGPAAHHPGPARRGLRRHPRPRAPRAGPGPDHAAPQDGAAHRHLPRRRRERRLQVPPPAGAVARRAPRRPLRGVRPGRGPGPALPRGRLPAGVQRHRRRPPRRRRPVARRAAPRCSSSGATSPARASTSSWTRSTASRTTCGSGLRATVPTPPALRARSPIGPHRMAGAHLRRREAATHPGRLRVLRAGPAGRVLRHRPARGHGRGHAGGRRGHRRLPHRRHRRPRCHPRRHRATPTPWPGPSSGCWPAGPEIDAIVAAGRLRAEHHSMDRLAALYLEQYERACRSERPPRSVRSSCGPRAHRADAGSSSGAVRPVALRLRRPVGRSSTCPRSEPPAAIAAMSS